MMREKEKNGIVAFMPAGGRLLTRRSMDATPSRGATMENDYTKYKNVITYLYTKIISGKTSIKDRYLVIAVPGKIYDTEKNGKADGHGAISGKYCFISAQANKHTPAHELGHNLGLQHTGNDLEQCGVIDIECEQGVHTNNIMGYDLWQNSFWHWQKITIQFQ
jgi:hypothetical protein